MKPKGEMHLGCLPGEVKINTTLQREQKWQLPQAEDVQPEAC